MIPPKLHRLYTSWHVRWATRLKDRRYGFASIHDACTPTLTVRMIQPSLPPLGTTKIPFCAHGCVIHRNREKTSREKASVTHIANPMEILMTERRWRIIQGGATALYIYEDEACVKAARLYTLLRPLWAFLSRITMYSVSPFVHAYLVSSR